MVKKSEGATLNNGSQKLAKNNHSNKGKYYDSSPFHWPCALR